MKKRVYFKIRIVSIISMLIILSGILSCKKDIEVEPVGDVLSSIEECDSGIKVILECETEGATIYYTTDSSDPSLESMEYISPLIFDEDTILRVFAVKKGMLDSSVSTIIITVNTILVEVEDTSDVEANVVEIKKNKTEFICTACGSSYEDAKSAAKCCKNSAVKKTETIYKYVCPNDNKEYDTAEEAADCCGVQTVDVKEIVNKYICPNDGKEYDTVADALSCCGPIVNTVTKYVCPKDKKEYDMAETAAECCGVQTVEKEVTIYKYVCPNDKKEFETVQEAADCCGVQIEYVDREVEKVVKKYVCSKDGKEYDTTEEAANCCDIIDIYEVTYDSKDGTLIETQYVVSGKKAVEPKDPTKTGYNFTGWYCGENIYDFTETVNSDVALTAMWEPIIYTVKLLDSDTSTVLRTLSVPYNQMVEIPTDIEKEGYILGNWYYSGTIFNLNKRISADISLVASWVEKYAVGNIVLSDGTILPNTISSLTDAQKSAAMAVIFKSKTSSSAALAMGINRESTTYAWTTKSDCNPGTGIAGTIASGDMDGSDNWDYIKGKVAEYPAFGVCVNYGTKYKLTSYETGWYLPTASELFSLYIEKSKVNEILKKIGSKVIEEKIYWTSNNNYRKVSSYDSYWQQNRNYYYYEADTINFSDGTESNKSNTSKYNVIAIIKIE